MLNMSSVPDFLIYSRREDMFIEKKDPDAHRKSRRDDMFSFFIIKKIK
jgi:hypothetical protein